MSWTLRPLTLWTFQNPQGNPFMNMYANVLFREEDQEWLSLKEESLIFNEAFVNSKYNDVDENKEQEDDEEDESDKVSSIENKVLSPSSYCC